MIACVNAATMIIPGFIIGALVGVIYWIRRAHRAERLRAEFYALGLNALDNFMWERGIHWGWWDRQDPWRDPRLDDLMEEPVWGTTASGKPITDERVERLAAKAEAGFDVEETLRRRRLTATTVADSNLHRYPGSVTAKEETQ